MVHANFIKSRRFKVFLVPKKVVFRTWSVEVEISHELLAGSNWYLLVRSSQRTYLVPESIHQESRKHANNTLF